VQYFIRNDAKKLIGIILEEVIINTACTIKPRQVEYFVLYPVFSSVPNNMIDLYETTVQYGIIMFHVEHEYKKTG